jgi:hypothetical protein
MVREYGISTQLNSEQDQPCLPVAYRQAYFSFQTLVTGNTIEHLQPYFFFPTLFYLKLEKLTAN